MGINSARAAGHRGIIANRFIPNYFGIQYKESIAEQDALGCKSGLMRYSFNEVRSKSRTLAD